MYVCVSLLYRGSVVAVDFYNAKGLLPMNERDLVQMVMDTLLPIANNNFRLEKHKVDSVLVFCKKIGNISYQFDVCFYLYYIL